ncbi:MAG TPA: ABC transporter permease, partial [Flavisolibacter sp.]|nr:ABC transporter permease [Flavisolibacter sp.]
MLQNYLKVALRYLSKHKGYTFINTLGLAVGLTCCILIMQFVKSEWSFDRFHPKTDRLYRAWLEEHYQGEIFRNTETPVPLGPVLQAGLPEAESVTRFAGLRSPVRYNNNTFNDAVAMVDSNFLRVFHFPLLQGDEKNPFATSNTLLITPATAQKYFGSDNPIGKNLELQLGKDTVLFSVAGVIKEAPLE